MTFVVGSQLKREGCRRLPHGRAGLARVGEVRTYIEQDTRPPFLPLSHYIINRSAWHFSTHGASLHLPVCACVCVYAIFFPHLLLRSSVHLQFHPVGSLVGLGPTRRHRHCVFTALLFVIIKFYGGSSFLGLSPAASRRTQCKFMPIYVHDVLFAQTSFSPARFCLSKSRFLLVSPSTPASLFSLLSFR